MTASVPQQPESNRNNDASPASGKKARLRHTFFSGKKKRSRSLKLVWLVCLLVIQFSLFGTLLYTIWYLMEPDPPAPSTLTVPPEVRVFQEAAALRLKAEDLLQTRVRPSLEKLPLNPNAEQALQQSRTLFRQALEKYAELEHLYQGPGLPPWQAELSVVLPETKAQLAECDRLLQEHGRSQD